jgi:hypothetical protein
MEVGEAPLICRLQAPDGQQKGIEQDAGQEPNA